MSEDEKSDADARRRLGGQIQLELLEEELVVGVGLGVARQDQLTPIGGRQGAHRPFARWRTSPALPAG